MPSPSSALTTLQPQLGTYFEYQFMAGETGFIANQVFPVTPVAKASGTFGKIPIEELLKTSPDLARAPATGYWRDSFQFTDASYACVDYGIEQPMDDREVELYSDYFTAMEIATARAVHRILVAQEIRVAALVADAATYTGALAQAVTNGKWDVSTSDPIIDVELAVAKFYANTGMWPNTIIMNEQVFRKLRIHPDIISAISSSGAGDQSRQADVTKNQLAQVFALPNVLVGGESKNTANPMAAASISQIWPDHVMVARIAGSADMQEPCLGRQFHWSQDGSQVSGRVETYREEAIRSEVVRVRHDIDEVRIHTEMALMIPDVLT